MSIEQYREKLRSLSDRLISLQRPIRILDSVKWPQDIENRFLDDFHRHHGTVLPEVTPQHYENNKLQFDSQQLQADLSQLQRDIQRQLGKRDELGNILHASAQQYQVVAEMLENRGQPTFATCSKQLYGSAYDHLRGDRRSLTELGKQLCQIFSLPAAKRLGHDYPAVHSATDAIDRLNTALTGYFGAGVVRVIQSDGIVSDAAAGSDYIKLNTRRRFSDLDLRVYEVHEGWVHVGTSLNGQAQPWATWLAIGSPRITANQEGLAVLMEILSFASFPDRARKISDRVQAVAMAEDGANFFEIFTHFLGSGLSEEAAWQITQRVFRGGDPAGGSYFTKDISYVRGFIENVNFIKSAILSDVPQLIPLMFAGKVTLDDIPVLYQHVEEGTVLPPRFLPPMFADINGLYVWFGFSSSLSQIDLGRVKRHFEKAFTPLKTRVSVPSA
ncbi:MAG: flavohemoglobin expression-modulating QEGLA motif protein [Pseudomonadales bacterium]|nr:flavohemoglobin expression-modulating QEGLA motif protein [Pseudomonadales bacterium]